MQNRSGSAGIGGRLDSGLRLLRVSLHPANAQMNPLIGYPEHSTLSGSGYGLL